MSEFFTDHFRTDGYNSSLSSSFQGQLASSYTAALTEMCESNADWLGFLAFDVNGLDVAHALLVKDAVAAGHFTLSGLFGAAQTTTSTIPNPVDPHPMLTVVVDGQTVTIDLTAILSHLDTETWTQTDTTGGGKKAVTTTTTHVREFYTDADQPEGYNANWSHPNAAPTVGHSITVETTETQSHFTDHVRTNLGSDPLAVNLITGAGATDPDGDTLHIVTNSVTLDGGGSLPSYITVVGDTIEIDRNSRLLDYLKADPSDTNHSLVVNLTYQITDGNGHVIDNTVKITITGTTDEYQGSGSGSAQDTWTGAEMPVHPATLDVGSLPDGFDFTFTGSITATSSGLGAGSPPEKFTLADAGINDWADPAINLTSSHTSETQTLDISGALDDLLVDFNINSTSSVDTTDSVTVKLDYSYEYYYLA